MKKSSKVANFFAKYVSRIVFLVLVGLAYYFYTVFGTFDMFPPEWKEWLSYGLIGMCAVLGLICIFPKLPNLTRILSMVLNILLCICLGLASWYLPHVRAQIEKAFTDIPTEGEAEINFYVLKDEYKVVNPDAVVDDTTTDEVVDDTTEDTTDESTTDEVVTKTLADYKDGVFLVQETVDLENQEYAMLVANREVSNYGLNEKKTLDIFDAVDQLYAGEGDVMVMNTSYIPLIEDITGYEDFLEKVDVVYTVYKKLQIIPSEATQVDVTTKPFNILILGTDEWGKKVDIWGRKDVNIIASINPTTKQVAFVSIPRDSYIPNACYYDMEDKLTHTGIYGNGVNCTESSIENYFGIEINYYVVLNFSSFVKIIDALGGLDVYNPYTFKANSIATYKGTFKEGWIHLTGKQAMAYVRERKSLKNGDVGRGEHQAIVLEALIEQLTQPAMITKIDQLLGAIEGTFKTNIKMDEIYALAQMQLDDMAMWNIVLYSLGGTGAYDYCPAMGMNQTYYVSYPKKNQITFVKNVMKQIKNGEVIEQGKLPK